MTGGGISARTMIKSDANSCQHSPDMHLNRKYVLLAALIGTGILLHAHRGNTDQFTVPVTYYTLPNGLRLILSPDHTAPTIVIGVYYRIGFRIEPKDRTAVAALFE